MNAAAKTLIIINLMLTLLFLYFLMVFYAFHQNWKTRWQDDLDYFANKTKDAIMAKADAEAKATHSQNVSEVTVVENKFLSEQVKLLRSEIANLETDIQTNEARIAALRRSLSEKDELLKTLNENYDLVRVRKEELARVAGVARGVAHVLSIRLAEMEDDYHQQRTKLTQALASLNELKEKSSRDQARLALLRERAPSLYDDIMSQNPTSYIEGVVARVEEGPDGKQQLVMLSVGRDEGVTEGTVFTIWRRNQYVVKVRADGLFGDYVGCQVLHETWNDNGAKIQPGDQAATRL